jgi:hypothetical protein
VRKQGTSDAIKKARGMLKGSGILKAYLEEKDLDKQREKLKHIPTEAGNRSHDTNEQA